MLVLEHEDAAIWRDRIDPNAPAEDRGLAKRVTRLLRSIRKPSDWTSPSMRSSDPASCSGAARLVFRIVR